VQHGHGTGVGGERVMLGVGGTLVRFRFRLRLRQQATCPSTRNNTVLHHWFNGGQMGRIRH